MEYKVFIEGQTIPVPPEIGETDDGVKNAMRPIFPEIANAQLTRTEKDGVTTITVIKKAGTKGGWQDLVTAPAGRNPVILLETKLAGTDTDQLDLDSLTEIDELITSTLEEGDRQNEMVGYALHRMKRSRPVATSTIPAGF
ncbi:hypothetical protein hrd7_25100 [Leptolinea sp. HRD-7]|nr:hypothetical protein hrd7_25100 [Leptolinea sp. HRD-7]